jgi:putative transcriptional regulator
MTVSLQGSFLIAAHQLRDANFYRSVVLLLEHSSQSAMGLVVNRPSGTSIGEALAQHSPVNNVDAPVFCGGPVEKNALFMLHNSVTLGKQDQEVAPGLFLAGSEQSFNEVVQKKASPGNEILFRLINGYAGWGAGQLESEMARGDWQVLPKADGLLLEEDPYGLWEVCIRRLNRMNRVLPQDVKNPEWN